MTHKLPQALDSISCAHGICDFLQTRLSKKFHQADFPQTLFTAGSSHPKSLFHWPVEYFMDKDDTLLEKHVGVKNACVLEEGSLAAGG